jgi:hypothetical protein
MFLNLLEVTYRPLKKQIDPALMTWEEYFKYNNPNQAIDVDLKSERVDFFNDFRFQKEDMISFGSDDSIEYFFDSLENRLFHKGNTPENIPKDAEIVKVDNIAPYLASRFKEWSFDYEENKKSAILLKQKVQKTIKGLFFKIVLMEKSYSNKDEIVVFNIVDGVPIVVGACAVYPNGLLITEIVADYAGYGIGKWLGETIRAYKPSAKSGPQSIGGFKMLKKIHKDAVRHYMASGIYSYLVRSGKLSINRVNEILLSTK